LPKPNEISHAKTLKVAKQSYVLLPFIPHLSTFRSLLSVNALGRGVKHILLDGSRILGKYPYRPLLITQCFQKVFIPLDLFQDLLLHPEFKILSHLHIIAQNDNVHLKKNIFIDNERQTSHLQVFAPPSQYFVEAALAAIATVSLSG
jgi:hypothetical protein